MKLQNYLIVKNNKKRNQIDQVQFNDETIYSRKKSISLQNQNDKEEQKQNLNKSRLIEQKKAFSQLKNEQEIFSNQNRKKDIKNLLLKQKSEFNLNKDQEFSPKNQNDITNLNENKLQCHSQQGIQSLKGQYLNDQDEIKNLQLEIQMIQNRISQMDQNNELNKAKIANKQRRVIDLYKKKQTYRKIKEYMEEKKKKLELIEQEKYDKVQEQRRIYKEKLLQNEFELQIRKQQNVQEFKYYQQKYQTQIKQQEQVEQMNKIYKVDKIKQQEKYTNYVIENFQQQKQEQISGEMAKKVKRQKDILEQIQRQKQILEEKEKEVIKNISITKIINQNQMKQLDSIQSFDLQTLENIFPGILDKNKKKSKKKIQKFPLLKTEQDQVPIKQYLFTNRSQIITEKKRNLRSKSEINFQDNRLQQSTVKKNNQNKQFFNDEDLQDSDRNLLLQDN